MGSFATHSINDTRHYDIQHNVSALMLSAVMLSAVMLSAIMLSAVILIVIRLSAVRLSAVVLRVDMLSVAIIWMLCCVSLSWMPLCWVLWRRVRGLLSVARWHYYFTYIWIGWKWLTVTSYITAIIFRAIGLSNWQEVQLNTDLLKHRAWYLYTKETGQLKLNEKERVFD